MKKTRSKLPFLKFKIFLSVLILFFWNSLWALENKYDGNLKGFAYHFPKPNVCTIMIDYQQSSASVINTNGDDKSLLLSRSMIKQYIDEGVQKCKGAPKIIILAVFIPGKDNYGRPDFGSRSNILKLEGLSVKFQALSTEKNLSLSKIKDAVSLYIY